ARLPRHRARQRRREPARAARTGRDLVRRDEVTLARFERATYGLGIVVRVAVADRERGHGEAGCGLRPAPPRSCPALRPALRGQWDRGMGSTDSGSVRLAEPLVVRPVGIGIAPSGVSTIRWALADCPASTEHRQATGAVARPS